MSLSLQTLLCCAIYLCMSPQNECYNMKNIISKVSKLRNKLNNNAKFVFGDNTGLEYPGNDPVQLAEIRQLWGSYYDCLNRRNRHLGLHRSVMPEAIMVFQGSSVRFECNACLSPVDQGNLESVQWYYGPLPNQGTTQVQYGEHVLLSPRDKQLHMFNVQTEQTGQYLCTIGDTVTGPYFLQVVGDSEPVIMVKPNSAPYALHTRPAITVKEKFELSTIWQAWSPCNKCGQVGQRVRSGICTVVLTDNADNTTKPTNEHDAAELVLHLFKKGIPCRSTLLPQTFRSLPDVAGRKSEVMVGYCKEECTQSAVFVVLDEDGNVTETANNTAGIYSTLQGVPQVPPPIERRTMFQGTDQLRTVIKCPGNLNTDTPILWQIGSYNINPLLIKEESKGRIFVNVQNHLIIKTPRETDSNIYSCWQSKELAGTVRLNVVHRVRWTFNHHVMIMSMVLVMGTFLLVFYRACKGRRRKLAR